MALALVSVWIAWTLAMWFVATRSFRTAERALSGREPRFVSLLQPLGPRARRVVLRGFAGEINTTYFRAYGVAQVLLGVAVVVLLGWRGAKDKTAFVLVLVMLVIAAVLAVAVAPQIASIGGTLDFGAPPGVVRRFWMLHGAYTALDGIKLLVGLALELRWLRT